MNNDVHVWIKVLEVNIVNNFTIATVQLISGEIKSLLIFEERETRQRWRMTGGPSFSNPNTWEKGLRNIALKYEGPFSEGHDLTPGTVLISTNSISEQGG